jgi:hypothetical protein
VQISCPLSSTATIGTSFSGYLWVEYDQGGKSGLVAQFATISLPVSTLSSACSGSVEAYVPIQITNGASAATQTTFQQELSVATGSYASYTTSNLYNVCFSTGSNGSGSALQAWVETNTGTDTVWVKLTTSIPAGGSQTIYMNFMSANQMSTTGPTGEAPQLSTPYAEYDNGGKVFNFYDNFEGTSSSPSSSWTVNTIGAGASATVNNGLTVTMTQTDSGIGIFTVSTYSTPLMAEADLTSYSNNCGSPYTGIFESLNNVMDTVNFAEPENSYLLSTGGSTLTYFAVTTPTASTNIYGPVSLPALPVVWGVAWLGTGSEATQIGSTSYTSTDSTLKFGRYHLGIANNAGFCLSTSAYQWFRARDYPPGGVQPAYSLGSFTEVS